MNLQRLSFAGTLFLAALLPAVQEEPEWGRRIPPREGDRFGERLQFTGVTADLDRLRELLAIVPGLSKDAFLVKPLGPEVLEVILVRGTFTDEQVRRVRKVLREHHESRAKAGQTGIVEKPREQRFRAPESWRKRYAEAKGDSEKLQILAEYLGMMEGQ